MKENFLHFLSNTPCMLNINSEKVGEIDNENTFEIDIISKTENMYITYEPITIKAQALPYTILLNTEDKPTTDNKYTTIVPFPHNNYDIILSPFFSYNAIDSKVLFNGNIGKYFISISTDTNTKIIIYSGLSIVFSKHLPIFSNVKVEEHKNIILVQGVITENKYYLLALDTTDFKILYNDYVESIESSTDSVTLYKTINSLCHHAEVCNINLNTKIIDKYHVFENNICNENINICLIPQAFLECIKLSDEKSAVKFLSEDINNTNITKLQKYFGSINNIYLNRHESNIHKLNYTIENDSQYHNYNFLIKNNKIYEIEKIF